MRSVYLAGRCANGTERDGGTLYHAVPDDSNTALCGAKPGRRSAGWSGDWLGYDIPKPVSCPRCLKRQAATEQADEAATKNGENVAAGELEHERDELHARFAATDAALAAMTAERDAARLEAAKLIGVLRSIANSPNGPYSLAAPLVAIARDMLAEIVELDPDH